MGTRVFSLTGLFPYDELSENLYGSLPTSSTDYEASVDSRLAICDAAIISWGEFEMLTLVNPLLIHINVWQKPLQYCKVIASN